MHISQSFHNGFTIQYWLKPKSTFSNYIYPFILEKSSGSEGPMKINIGHKTDTNETYYMQLYMSSSIGSVYQRITMNNYVNTLFSGSDQFDKDQYIYHQISIRRNSNHDPCSGTINIRIGFQEDYEDKYVEASKSFNSNILSPFNDISGSELYDWRIGAMSSTPYNNVYNLFNFRIWGEEGSTVGFIDISGTIDETKFDYFMELPETVYMKDMNAYNYLIGWYKLDGNRYISGSTEYVYNTAPSNIIGNLPLQHSGSNMWKKDKITSYSMPIKSRQRRTEHSKIRWKENDIDGFVNTNEIMILGTPSEIFEEEFTKYFSKNQLNIVNNRDELLYSSSFETLTNFRNNIATIFNFSDDFYNFDNAKNIFKKIFNFLPKFLEQFIPERVVTFFGLLISNTFYNRKKWPLQKPEISLPSYKRETVIPNIQELFIDKIDENVALYNITNEVVLSEITQYEKLLLLDQTITSDRKTYEVIKNVIPVSGSGEVFYTGNLTGTCFSKINKVTVNANKKAVEKRKVDNIFIKDLKTID